MLRMAILTARSRLGTFIGAARDGARGGVPGADGGAPGPLGPAAPGIVGAAGALDRESLAAQLWTALSADLPSLEADVTAGNFAPLREWLREHIHRHGRKYDSRELLRRATGEELSVDPWLAYLEGKLLDAGLLAEPVRRT